MDRIGIIPEKDTIIVELHQDEYKALRALQDACGHSSSWEEDLSRLTRSPANIALWLVAVHRFMFNLEQLTQVRKSLDEIIKAVGGDAKPRPEGEPSIWDWMAK